VRVSIAQGIKGPHSCAEFESKNPSGCDGCPHKGKITSPIALGKEIMRAEEQDNTVEVEDEDGEVEQHFIPPYPLPYFRGKNGGIYCRVLRENDKGEEEEKIELICDRDFYVVKRMIDPDAGQTILIRVHMPKDGVEDFVMPLTTSVSKEANRNLENPVTHQSFYQIEKGLSIFFFRTKFFIVNSSSL
jgi:hypothetical protein